VTWDNFKGFFDVVPKIVDVLENFLKIRYITSFVRFKNTNFELMGV